MKTNEEMLKMIRRSASSALWNSRKLGADAKTIASALEQSMRLILKELEAKAAA